MHKYSLNVIPRRKRKAFCSKQTPPDRDYKSSTGYKLQTPTLWFKSQRSPLAIPRIFHQHPQRKHLTRFPLNWNPKAAPTAPHKANCHLKKEKIRHLLNTQKAIMLKTQGEPCKVRIKSQRHRRREKYRIHRTFPSLRIRNGAFWLINSTSSKFKLKSPEGNKEKAINNNSNHFTDAPV